MLPKWYLAAKRFSIKNKQTFGHQKLKLKELIFSWTFLCWRFTHLLFFPHVVYSHVGSKNDIIKVLPKWCLFTALRQRHASPGILTHRDYLTQTLWNSHCQKEIHLLPEDWIIFSQAPRFLIKQECSIILVPMSDHRGCCIAILLSEVVKGPGYWKFNNSLLDNINYLNEMKEVTDSFIIDDNTANQDQQS